jgi:hypothetical protein
MMNTDTPTIGRGAIDHLAVAAATLAAAGIVAVAVSGCPDPTCRSCAPVARERRRPGDDALFAA